MPVTSSKVLLGLFDVTLKTLLDFTGGPAQFYSNFSNLKYGTSATKRYASFEQDFWLLDGSYKNTNWTGIAEGAGWVSLEMSDENSTFAILPVLTLESPVGPLTTKGMTIYFSEHSGDWCDNIRIQAYNAAAVEIFDQVFTPTTFEFSFPDVITNFETIEITINSTNKPYRYARIMGIEFGTSVEFDNDMINELTIVEHGDRLSAELPIGSLELRLNTTDAGFSILDTSGTFFDLQFGQPLDVYAYVDGVESFIGRFYLNTWTNTSDVETHLTAVDAIGLLDIPTYYGGLLSATLISTATMIVSTANVIAEYELGTMSLTGQYPNNVSSREALQRVLFSTMFYAYTARSKVIQLRPANLSIYLDPEAEPGAFDAIDYIITVDDMAMGKSLTIRPYVHGVEIKGWLSSSTVGPTVELFNANLAVGEHTLRWTENYILYAVTNATILSQTSRWITINVPVAGTILVEGKLVTVTRPIARNSGFDVNSGITQNILSIETDFVQGGSVGDNEDLANHVYGYYQERYKQTFKLFAHPIKPGDSVLVDTFQGKQIIGIVEKVTLDLSGGWTSDVEIVGIIAP